MENQNEKKELTLTRTFDLPAQLVWNAWTDPKLLEKWWGPQGVSIPDCIFDLKPEGKIYIVMLAGSDLGPLKGSRWPMSGVVKEIDEPHRLVYTSSALAGSDEHAMLGTLNTLTLEEENGKTIMTLHIVVTKVTKEAEGALAGMEMGWSQSLDKLVAFLG